MGRNSHHCLYGGGAVTRSRRDSSADVIPRQSSERNWRQSAAKCSLTARSCVQELQSRLRLRQPIKRQALSYRRQRATEALLIFAAGGALFHLFVTTPRKMAMRPSRRARYHADGRETMAVGHEMRPHRGDVRRQPRIGHRSGSPPAAPCRSDRGHLCESAEIYRGQRRASEQEGVVDSRQPFKTKVNDGKLLVVGQEVLSDRGDASWCGNPSR